jgi:hypothetical protein
MTEFLNVRRCEDGHTFPTLGEGQGSGYPGGQWWSPVSVTLDCEHEHAGPGHGWRLTVAGEVWCRRHADHQYSITIKHLEQDGIDYGFGVIASSCACGGGWRIKDEELFGSEWQTGE